MKIVPIVALALCAASFATQAAESKEKPKAGEHAMEPQPVPPELDRLDWLVGKWKADMRWEASEMGPAGSSTGRETIVEGPGGQSFIQNFEGQMEGQPYSGHGVITYDPQKKQYISTWNDSYMPGLMVMKGTLKGDRIVYEGESVGPDGKPHRHRSTVSNMSPDAYTFTMERQENGAWRKSFTIDYTKQK